MEEMLSRNRNHASGANRKTGPPVASQIGLRVTAVALWAVLFGLLLTLGLFVASQADTAERILTRSIPQLTELDGLLALHAADLQTRAQADLRTPVTMSEFPVQVSLPAGQIAHASPDRLAEMVSRRAAAKVYQLGPSAFASTGSTTRNQTGPFLSSQWAVHRALDLLNAHTHSRLSRLLLILGFASLVLALAYCWQRPEGGRLTALGILGVAAAIVAALVSMLVRAGVEIAGGSARSALGLAGWGMLADVSWSMAVVSLLALAGFAALALAGYLTARIEGQTRRKPDANPAPARRPVLEMVPTGTRPLDRLPKPPPPPSN
jgi:hypothetical protein